MRKMKEHNSREIQKLLDKMEDVSSPQEARKLHKELKEYGMSGLPLFVRYPKLSENTCVISVAILAVTVIIKVICR